ncbi:cyclin-T1-4-like [Miscanthus floridulus]|uniref:cyclin-T1-4-like n=1 Tax=Miscanthus floridulus TaxID=154761 RepID=UPI00345A8AFF
MLGCAIPSLSFLGNCCKTSDFSYHGVVDNGPNGFTQGRLQEATKLGPSWYFSRKELKENFSSRRDVNDWNKESNLRKSYCKFLQDLGKNMNCTIKQKKSKDTNSFSSDHGLHHLFDYLLAFKMMGSHLKETS